MTKCKKCTKEFKLDVISLIRNQMLGRCIKEAENQDGQAFWGNGKLTTD
jgi:hypothetical protein